jgi:hypothetical protein
LLRNISFNSPSGWVSEFTVGIIFVAEDKSKAGKTALKVHRSVEPYLREREVYERLRDAGVSEILGFNVPQLIRFDDESSSR